MCNMMDKKLWTDAIDLFVLFLLDNFQNVCHDVCLFYVLISNDLSQSMHFEIDDTNVASLYVLYSGCSGVIISR